MNIHGQVFPNRVENAFLQKHVGILRLNGIVCILESETGAIHAVIKNMMDVVTIAMEKAGRDKRIGEKPVARITEISGSADMRL